MRNENANRRNKMGSMGKFNGVWVQILGINGDIATIRNANGTGSLQRVGVDKLTDTEQKSWIEWV